MQHRLRWTCSFCLVALLCGFVLHWAVTARGAVVAAGYTPVAPAEATNRALGLSVEILAEWVEQTDFASANDSCKELDLLIWLYGQRSDNPTWKEQIDKLSAIADALTKDVRAKNPAGCKVGIDNFKKQLAQMKMNPPKGSKPTGKNLRLIGSTKSWMLMMDSAYTEGKLSDDAKVLAVFAEALAEEVNAVGYMRADAGWRTLATEARDLALEAAKVARNDGVKAAKPILKRANQRCEMCHKRY